MSLNEIRMMPYHGQLLMVGLNYDQEVLLKARLQIRPNHPRAAITLLEGLALWSGQKLPVALGVSASCASSIEALLPDGLAWNSPLVDIHLVDPRSRRKTRINGVGDCRKAVQLRLPVLP